MINNVTIMGRLTADPELKQTPSGASTCTVTVAVERSYAPQGQERQTDFIPVVAWRQTAEFISRNFSKGKLIAVTGQLRTRTYTDKRYSDVTHYVMELYADSVSFCGDKTTAPAQPAPPPTVLAVPDKPAEPQAEQARFYDFEGIIGDDNLPF
ncbi:MAG: single-stranded DNA-binding protein [Oscillospiraceae bacterium]|nr:single-stranded DNA-binding protein [Oscillospiraceae bacterium]